MIVTLKVPITGLGSRLKRLREKKGVTQQILAKQLKCTKSYISKVESEDLSADLSVKGLLSIVKSLGYFVPNSLKITSKEELIRFLDNLEKTHDQSREN